MRVLIISQYYKPEPIPKPVEIAQWLVSRRDEVTVITGFPNYPSGKLYPGYNLGLVRREDIDGVRVFRTFEFPYHGSSAIGRIVNYLTFMLSAPIGALFTSKCDVIYVWHPPLTVGIAAWIISRFKGVPFIYDVQDIWPESAVLSGMLKPGFMVRCLSLMEQFVYRRADHILVITDGARNNLISKGVPVSKISVTPGWFDSSDFPEGDGAKLREEMRMTLGWRQRFVFLFAGNLGVVQGLDTIVRAADLLRDLPQVQFAFIGDGVEKTRMQELVKNLGLSSQVQFIDRQTPSDMPRYYAAADGLLVHLKWSEISDYVIPLKTLAYFASGKPIIMAMRGASAQLVLDANAGCVVAPEDPNELALAIRRFLVIPANQRAQMGASGKEYLKRKFSKEIVLPQYYRILERIAGKFISKKSGESFKI